jgi:hypothetical protein
MTYLTASTRKRIPLALSLAFVDIYIIHSQKYCGDNLHIYLHNGVEFLLLHANVEIVTTQMWNKILSTVMWY